MDETNFTYHLIVFRKAIMLSRIKLSPSQIKVAILSADDNALTVDDLKAIERYVPTDEEVRHMLHARIRLQSNTSTLILPGEETPGLRSGRTAGKSRPVLCRGTFSFAETSGALLTQYLSSL